MTFRDTNNKMLSSLVGYIWGGEEQPTDATPPDTPPVSARSHSPAGEDDWELVGSPTSQLGLGSLSTPREEAGDTSVVRDEKDEDLELESRTEAESENGSISEMATNGEAGRSRVPANINRSLGTPQAKLQKTAQLTRQRSSGKAISSKSLKRSNKNSLVVGNKRKTINRTNFNIKMAGANKNLKQC